MRLLLNLILLCKTSWYIFHITTISMVCFEKSIKLACWQNICEHRVRIGKVWIHSNALLYVQ